jgi:hypothetical protein
MEIVDDIDGLIGRFVSPDESEGDQEKAFQSISLLITGEFNKYVIDI